MASTNESRISIKPLTASYIPAALRLCREAGWNQVEADWQRLVVYEPSGCFAAFQGSKLVGTITTTTYGRQLAWIGMMLVAQEYRRQGIATALMQKAIGALRSRNVECIKLDATPEGEFVYAKLGFETEWSYHRWKRDAIDSADADSTRCGVTSLPSTVVNVDLEACGADRSRYLNELCRDSVVAIRESGLGMSRAGYLATYLGPVCATDPNAARSIIRELVKSSLNTMFWDIPSSNAVAKELATELGFAPVRTLKRMRQGQSAKSPRFEFQFALAGPATG